MIFKLCFVFLLISPELCCMTIQWTIHIWISKKALNRQQNCSDIIRRSPFFLKNIQTYVSMTIYVGMKAWCLKDNCGGSVRIICWKVDSQHVFQVFIYLHDFNSVKVNKYFEIKRKSATLMHIWHMILI